MAFVARPGFLVAGCNFTDDLFVEGATASSMFFEASSAFQPF